METTGSDGEQEVDGETQYTTLSGAAATSLIQLSQSKTGEDSESETTTIVLQQQDTVDTVVEIPDVEGSEAGGFILVTTEDNVQKLVPMPQVSTEEH